ncbi:MAG TPA: hypothetical protein VF067_01310 [Sphingomicrobium sp.]
MQTVREMPIRTDELQQSLAAATNYVNVARLLLASLTGEVAAEALKQLEHAEAQLLRAGDAVRILNEEP